MRMTDSEAGSCLAAVGCRACGGSGYRGRVGLYEMLPISSTVRAALMAGASEQAITSAASAEGFRPLIRLGVEAAVAGLTTPAELLRTLVIHDDDPVAV